MNVLPKVGATIPSNTPALAVGGSGAVNVELHENDGTRVPTTLRPDPDSPSRKLLVPTAPLVAGKSYEVIWQCQDSTSAKSSFSTIAAEPMPTTTGTANFDKMFRGNIDSCGGGVEADPTGAFVFLPVHLTPAADLRDFASIVTYFWETDGHPAEVVRTESGPAVYMSCATGTESKTFHLRIRSIIPGAASQPQPFEADLRMSCDSADWDVGAVVHDQESDSSTSSSSSCAVRASRRTKGAGLGVAGLGIAASLLGRRRRRNG